MNALTTLLAFLAGSTTAEVVRLATRGRWRGDPVVALVEARWAASAIILFVTGAVMSHEGVNAAVPAALGMIACGLIGVWATVAAIARGANLY